VKQRLLLALLTSLVAGCAATPSESASGQAESSLYLSQKAGKAGTTRRYEPPTAQPEALTGNPYTKTAGADEDPNGAPVVASVRLVLPTLSSPVPQADRPELPRKSRLAVALVRDGLLTAEADPILELDQLLLREESVRGVFLLGALNKAEVGLKDLAARAKAEGRDLLLVDIRPAPDGTKRLGLLVSVKTGALLARYEVADPKHGSKVSTGPRERGLCERLGRVYKDLKEWRP
jgi:hypothetical protein